MADPVLTAALSGQRAILLSWTFGSNADFQVFWKSSVPSGQEYVLLASTNAFSYTTGNLEASKTYFFYVRANVGATFFYSNTVELFVSCGKGVVLSADPPPSPPAQEKSGDIYVVNQYDSIYIRYSGRGDFIFYYPTSGLGIYAVGAAPFGSVYAAQYGGTIYKQSGGIGDFVDLNVTSRFWTAINLHPNGNVYATNYGVAGAGQIYMQTGGVGDFVSLAQESVDYRDIVCAPNGDVYAVCHYYGGSWGKIFKQTGGVGDFVSNPGWPRKYWYSVGVAANGGIYAGENDGDIWYLSPGGSTFVGLNQTIRKWTGICGAPNGDIYACVQGGNIYKRTAGAGDFVSLNQAVRQWLRITVRRTV